MAPATKQSEEKPAAGRIEEVHVEEAVLSLNKGTSCGTMGLPCVRSIWPTRSIARTAQRCCGT